MNEERSSSRACQSCRCTGGAASHLRLNTYLLPMLDPPGATRCLHTSQDPSTVSLTLSLSLLASSFICSHSTCVARTSSCQATHCVSVCDCNIKRDSLTCTYMGVDVKRSVKKCQRIRSFPKSPRASAGNGGSEVFSGA